MFFFLLQLLVAILVLWLLVLFITLFQWIPIDNFLLLYFGRGSVHEPCLPPPLEWRREITLGEGAELWSIALSSSSTRLLYILGINASIHNARHRNMIQRIESTTARVRLSGQFKNCTKSIKLVTGYLASIEIYADRRRLLYRSALLWMLSVFETIDPLCRDQPRYNHLYFARTKHY